MDSLNVDNIRCDDPQFIEVLIVCLHKEIIACKQVLNNHDVEAKKVKAKVYVQVTKKKEVKQKIKETKELVLILISINQKLEQHIKKAAKYTNIIIANIDDTCKINSLEMVQHQYLLNQYKSVWSNYHIQYEESQAAKFRMKEYINWQYFHIDHMIIEHRINKFEKILCKISYTDWIRTQSMIINLCKLLEKRLKKCCRITNVKARIYSHKEEYKLIKVQLNKQWEEQAEQERIRTQYLLEMPPPKMTLSHIYFNYIRKNQWTGIREDWNQNKTASDSISVNSILLEDIRNIDEDAMHFSKGLDNFKGDKNLFVSKHDLLQSNDSICKDNISKSLLITETRDMGEQVRQNKQFVLTQMNINKKGMGNQLNTKIIEPLSSKDCKKKIQPQIKKVENIQLEMFNNKSMQINTTNLFSPHHYEYCESNLDEYLESDSQHKECSTYEESLKNFNMTKCSNISSISSIEAEKSTELCTTINNTSKEKSHQEDIKVDNSPQYNFVNVLQRKSSHFPIF